MSEIGPMSSSSRFRWRISSCANANGMAGSSAHQSAMDAPSGTKRVTASARLACLSVSAALLKHSAAVAHLPLNSGLRFSTNAFTPSRASSLLKRRMSASRSILRPCSSGRPYPWTAASLIWPTA